MGPLSRLQGVLRQRQPHVVLSLISCCCCRLCRPLQSLCEVCSVSYSHVCNLAAGIDPPPVMVDLNPLCLEDVIADVSWAGVCIITGLVFLVKGMAGMLTSTPCAWKT